MLIRCFFTFWCFTLICIPSFSQIVQGKITDKQSGEAIPFVSIGLIGGTQATITNENGEFILKDISFPSKIRFSHIGYLPKEIEIEKPILTLAIALDPAAINLAEVSIDPYAGERLVRAAFEKAAKISSKTFYASAFYRQLITINEKPSQIYELFYDLKIACDGIKGWLAKQSRFAELNEGIAFSMTNQSYLTFSLAKSIFDNQKKGPFPTLKTLKNYRCVVERYLEQADQNIAVVSLKYKGNKKHYYVNVTYYIGQNDKYIYRTESSIFNLPMSFSGSSIKIPPVLTSVSTFKIQANNYPVTESVSTKMFLTLQTHKRTIKPQISSLLSIYQLQEQGESQKFELVHRNVQDKALVESITYDPIFWKNNEIVKQTTLADSFVKMMENKAAFGTMIEKP